MRPRDKAGQVRIDSNTNGKNILRAAPKIMSTVTANLHGGYVVCGYTSYRRIAQIVCCVESQRALAWTQFHLQP